VRRGRGGASDGGPPRDATRRSAPTGVPCASNGSAHDPTPTAIAPAAILRAGPSSSSLSYSESEPEPSEPDPEAGPASPSLGAGAADADPCESLISSTRSPLFASLISRYSFRSEAGLVPSTSNRASWARPSASTAAVVEDGAMAVAGCGMG